MRVFVCFILLLAIGVLAALDAPADPASPSPVQPVAQKKLPLADKFGDPLPEGAIARLGTIRHRSTASSFVVTPDGKTLLTLTGGTVSRLDIDTGLVLATTTFPRASASTSRFSQDGKTLVVPQNGGLALYDIATAKRLNLLPIKTPYWAVAPDGKTLAAAGDTPKRTNCIRLWDGATGQDRVFVELPNYVSNVAFSHDGKRLLAAVETSSLWCWDLSTGKELWRNESVWSTTIVTAPDGRTVCTDHLGRGPSLWDAHTGKAIGSLKTENATNITFSPDSKMLAVGTTEETLLWDVAKQEVRRRIETLGRQVTFSADGRSLFTLGDLILRWDVETGKQSYKDTRGDGHVGAAEAVKFAPDGKSLATWGKDATVRLWSLEDSTSRTLRTDAPAGRQPHFVAREINGMVAAAPLAFLPDGRQLLTALADHSIALMDVVTAKEIRRFNHAERNPNQLTLAAVQLNQDGRSLLALGYALPTFDSSIAPRPPQPLRSWDVASGMEIGTRTVEVSPLGCAGFSPDGRLLIDFQEKTIHDLKTGGVIPFSDRPPRLGPVFAFSADSRLLAVMAPHLIDGPAKDVLVYDLLTRQQLFRVEASLGWSEPLDLSADGRLLAASCPDGLYVWEVSTGKPLLHQPARGDSTYWTPQGFATSLAFSPNGKTLATGHANGTVLCWDMTPAWKNLTTARPPVDADACWAALADADPQKAYTSIDRLVAAPGKALELMRTKVVPAAKVKQEWIAARLADLDSNKFAVREAATRDLKEVAGMLESELWSALENLPSAEVRMRLQAILKTLDNGKVPVLQPDDLRQLRSLTVLERIGSKEATALLRDLAAGAPDARLTQDANAALQRLNKLPR